MPIKHTVKARSLQEWMERTGTSGRRLCALVAQQTGHAISPESLSYILRKSRRCSVVNAVALSAVTGIDSKVLRKWSSDADSDKSSVGGTKRVA